MDQERSEVIVTPRYLSDSTWMMRVSLMQTDKLGGKRLREMSMNLVWQDLISGHGQKASL